MRLHSRALRALKALSLGCLLTPALAIVLGSLPPNEVGHALAGKLLGLPIWINRQLPQPEPWSDHIAHWRREGYAVFDFLLVSSGAVIAWLLMPSRLGLLPGVTLLFVPTVAAVTFGWLGTPQRSPWDLMIGIVVGLFLSIVWAQIVSTRVKRSERRALFLLAGVVLGCLALLFESLYYYLFLVSALLTFTSSATLLIAWHSSLTHEA